MASIVAAGSLGVFAVPGATALVFGARARVVLRFSISRARPPSILRAFPAATPAAFPVATSPAILGLAAGTVMAAAAALASSALTAGLPKIRKVMMISQGLGMR